MDKASKQVLTSESKCAERDDKGTVIRWTSPPSDREGQGLEFEISPAKVCRFLFFFVIALVLLGTVARVVIYEVAPAPDHKLAKLMNRFDLGHEPSLPNWYSSGALLASSILLAFIATAKKRTQGSYVLHWFSLSFLFIWLALDEAIMIHEMADATLHDWLDSGGILYFAWVIPGAALVLIVSTFFMKFVLHLEKKTRLLFIAAFSMYVGGALGVELIEGVIVDAYGFESIRLTFAQAVEECLEMLGIVLFIYALLDYLARHIGEVRFRTA